MTNLTTAHRELFRRGPDETFPTFEALHEHCQGLRNESTDLWERPQGMTITHDLSFCVGEHPDLKLNDWSFSQLCRMAGVSKETINRLSAKTASKAFEETLPGSEKPLQILTRGDLVRSLHGVAYTRLWNADLLDVVRETAHDFTPPQVAMNGATGLYCGEQDMFCFLIDPVGWTEIAGEAFAPGFFVWNSEVGRRSLGIQTFWFQKICQNHIVWDAVEVVDFSRKHTANVRDGLTHIRRHIEPLVARRDERRDAFARVVAKAMTERLGTDAEEVSKVLVREGVPRNLIKPALELAREQGGFTIFAIVDALTRLNQTIRFAGDRMEADATVAALLALAA